MHHDVITLLHKASSVIVDAGNRLEALENRSTSSREVTHRPAQNVKLDTNTIEKPIAETDPKPEKAPWVWVSGDTLQYKQVFRDAQGRWSRRRRSWYWTDPSAFPDQFRDLPGIEVTISRT